MSHLKPMHFASIDRRRKLNVKISDARTGSVSRCEP